MCVCVCVKWNATTQTTDNPLSCSRKCLMTACEVQVALAWAVSIEPKQGTQLLTKLGLLDAVIEYALESGAFAQAFQLCQAPPAQHKMPDCHLKYAMFLEDEGELSAAEDA